MYSQSSHSQDAMFNLLQSQPSSTLVLCLKLPFEPNLHNPQQNSPPKESQVHQIIRLAANSQHIQITNCTQIMLSHPVSLQIDSKLFHDSTLCLATWEAHRGRGWP
ncbi:hypothetical protein KC19_10G143700 [Ceratodon purpureus]|uniref:Uncharacterized protein n=1 Tax=Ceratodon purpureus TaxID=3225 RepID=A0A8T0GLV7_CERPU|nr:hypothetical protein KC19_10G143700 [Ceratodon purpureus]